MAKYSEYTDGKPLTPTPRDPDWIDWTNPSKEDLAKYHQRVGPVARPERANDEYAVRKKAAAEREILLAKLIGEDPPMSNEGDKGDYANR